MEELASIDWSLKGAALGGAGLMAIIAFVKGVMRQIAGMACLGLACVAGYFGWQHGAEVLGNFVEAPSLKMVTLFSIGAGGVVHIVSKFFSTRLIRGLSADGAKRGFMGRIGSSLFSLMPTSFLMWVSATALRLTGNAAEADLIKDEVDAEGGSYYQGTPMLVKVKDALNEGWLGEFLQKTDPFDSDEKSKLSGLLMLYKDSEAWIAAQKLPEVQKLLDNPKIKRLLIDKQVREEVAKGSPGTLTSLNEFSSALEDEEIRAALSELNIEETADSALYEEIPETTTTEFNGPERKKRRKRPRIGGRRTF